MNKLAEWFGYSMSHKSIRSVACSLMSIIILHMFEQMQRSSKKHNENDLGFALNMSI